MSAPSKEAIEVLRAKAAMRIAGQQPADVMVDREILKSLLAEYDRLGEFESRVAAACREAPCPCFCGYHITTLPVDL